SFGKLAQVSEVPLFEYPMPEKFPPTPPTNPPSSAHYGYPPPPHRTILPASPRGSPRDNRRNKRHRHRGSPRGEHPFRAMQPEKSQARGFSHPNRPESVMV